MTRKLRVGCDMDGVIADFMSASAITVEKQWGIKLKREHVKYPRTADLLYNELFSEEQKAQYSGPRDLYSLMCPKEFFYNIKPFPGAIETLKQLCDQYDVTIITKPLEWVNCPNEKARWLKKYLPDSNYGLIMTQTMEVKGLVDVDIMIDDDPRALSNIKNGVPIAVRQPWNEEFLKFEPIRAVDSFADIMPIIKQVQSEIW
jgi:5'(3')-deoxyribonucleotidase